MGDKRVLNPGLADVFTSLIREIREWIASGQPILEPDVYANIRKRANNLRPFQADILKSVADQVKAEQFSLKEAQTIAITLFGKKSVWRWYTELVADMDVIVETVIQPIRRAEADPALVEEWNRQRTVENLTLRGEQVLKEEKYWFEVLADLRPNLEATRNLRRKINALETAAEKKINEIDALNCHIRSLKSKAQKAKGEDLVRIVEEAKALALIRITFRSHLQKMRDRLGVLTRSWLAATEQKIVLDAVEAMAALGRLFTEEDEIWQEIANPSLATVPAIDDDAIASEALMNVARRIRQKISGQPRYRREVMEEILARIENDACVLEV